MAYFEDRALRARNLPGIAPDLSRLAALLLVFAVAAGVVMKVAPAADVAPGTPDWHGNVAASGWSR